MLFVLITTVFATCFFLMFRVGPVFFKENWHINESVIGIYLALNGIIIALFEIIMISWLEKKYNPLRNIIAGSSFLAFSFLLLSVHSSFVYLSALLAIVLFTIGEMFSLPFISTFVVSRTHEHNRGQYAAAYTLCWSISQVIGPAGGFYLAQHWGYTSLWILIFVLLAGCAASYYLLDKKIRNTTFLNRLKNPILTSAE